MNFCGEYKVIIGLGSDIIDIRRIERTLDRFGDRFINRIFTSVEVAKSDNRISRSSSYAKRFAAKEACSKALGTGFRKGTYWRDIGVSNLPTGAPTIILTGGALENLIKIIPQGMSPNINLTMTDDYPIAEAVVIISANK